MYIEEGSQPAEGQEEGEKAAVILGPVVGRVEVVRQSGLVRESCRVPVVIEVDRGGPVTCMVRCCFVGILGLYGVIEMLHMGMGKAGEQRDVSE